MSLASYYEDIIDARGESKSSKSGKQKVSNRREPPKKQYVPGDDICFESLLNNLPVSKPSQPTPKDDIDARGESKQPKKPSLKAHQRSRQRELRRKQDVPIAKTRYVPLDEIQRRIQREIIRQGKETRVYV